MTAAIDAVDLARAERERRRRERVRAFPSYAEWLPLASPSFTWTYRWLRYIQTYYDRVTSGEITRLMVFAPPQHGKSASGTVRYPVYRIEREPDTRVIIAAHSQALANKFSRQAKAIASRRFALATDKKSVAEWETQAGGGVKAVGVGGAVAGNPAELVFIDDPVRSRASARSLLLRDALWDWYHSDIMTRVQERGAVILQTTRWHADDLAGRILESEDAPNWTVVCLRALAEEDDPLGRAVGEALCPERFTRETLLAKQRTMRLSFESLYQQRPTLAEGDTFRRADFKLLALGAPVIAASRVRHWDLAATHDDGDWTVGVRLARTPGPYVVEHVERFRLGPADRDARIRRVCEADPPGTHFSFEQEPGSGGKAQAHALVKLMTGYSVSFDRSTGSKETRAEPFASQLGADNVRLLPGPWVAPYVAELTDFPQGKHDDQVDASSGAFNKLNRRRQSQST